MEIMYLRESQPLPDPACADKSGLLAAGGSLTKARLIEAYSKGIFPWYSEGDPVLWWSPDPRVILIPDNLHISKKMKILLKKKVFRVTLNMEFGNVVEMCSGLRRSGEGTWITEDMKNAYMELHKAGYAHSVEVWEGDILAGGLYGVSFGKMFFGESMFSIVSNSSKFGFIKLTEYLKNCEYLFVDCQVETDHLKSLGAIPLDRNRFLKILHEGVNVNGLKKTEFPSSL